MTCLGLLQGACLARRSVKSEMEFTLRIRAMYQQQQREAAEKSKLAAGKP